MIWKKKNEIVQRNYCDMQIAVTKYKKPNRDRGYTTYIRFNFLTIFSFLPEILIDIRKCDFDIWNNYIKITRQYDSLSFHDLLNGLPFHDLLICQSIDFQFTRIHHISI